MSQYEHISVSQGQRPLVLTVELKQIRDYDLAEAMGKEFTAATGHEQAVNVVVDMGSVKFLSSVAYGPFITLRAHVRESGGRLILCNLSEPLKDMFETTHLLINPHSPDSLFEYAETLDDAIQMLSGET